MDVLVWTATNLISALILPPGVFIVLITIGLAAGAKRRWGRWLAGLSLAALTLLSLNVVGYALQRPFEDAWPPLDLARVKGLQVGQAIIVVLGGGLTLGAIEYADEVALAANSMRRTLYAARLAAVTGLPLAVAGGGDVGVAKARPTAGVGIGAVNLRPTGGGEDGALKPRPTEDGVGGAAKARRTEAGLMKDLLEQGFGRQVAAMEDKSFDTRQNALNMAKALAGRKTRTVVLVTDVVHMPRAARAFEAAGLKVVAAPMYFRASAPLNITDFLPSADGLMLSGHVLHEYVGAAWYALRRAVAG